MNPLISVFGIIRFKSLQNLIKLGGKNMARYTGPAWKVSRRLKYSTLESGKEFGLAANGKQKEIMHQDNMVNVVQNYLNMVFNYKKNKK